MCAELKLAAYRQQQDRAHEDRYCFTQTKIEGIRFALYAVFDGHSSPQEKGALNHVVLHCEQFFGPKLLEFLKQENVFLGPICPLRLQVRIHQFCMDFDEEMHQKKLVGGSTCSALLVIGNFVFQINIGDSFSVLFQTDGTILSRTKDHSPTDERERNRIVAAKHFIFYDRMDGLFLVSRSFGDFSWKDYCGTYHPEKNAMTCVPDIVFFSLSSSPLHAILATDGMYEVFKENDCVPFYVKHINMKEPDYIQKLADKMMQQFPKPCGQDDVTFLLAVLYENM